MAKKLPLLPKRPEKICWGCDRYCPANSMSCGNGSERSPHPVELFGEDWYVGDPDLDPAEDPSAAPEIPD